MPTFVMDGNFSAEHLRPRGLGDDVALGDGQGFMVTDAPYKAHLANSREVSEVRHNRAWFLCGTHQSSNRNATRTKRSIAGLPHVLIWRPPASARWRAAAMVASFRTRL